MTYAEWAGAGFREGACFSAKTQRAARDWALRRSALRASLPCPSLAAAPGGGQEIQEIHEIQERPYGATDEATQPTFQASRPPNFQASIRFRGFLGIMVCYRG